jgi:GTP-binding protein
MEIECKIYFPLVEERRFVSRIKPVRFLLILTSLLQLLIKDTVAFVPSSVPVPVVLSKQPAASLSSSLLFMARSDRPSGGGGGNASTKNAKTTKKPTKTKRDKPAATSTQPSKSAQVNVKQKKTSSAPPWQIISSKDMKKQVQAETKRRELAQQGIHASPNAEVLEDFTLSNAFLDPVDKSILAWKRFSPSSQHIIKFFGSFLDKRLPPRIGVPEIAFLGRSNVGKSSLLNKLIGSETARVGKTPGATASVNLYGMLKKQKPILGLVDLPGFGYAKLSKESKESVQLAAENYLGKRTELVLGILLVDIRRVPSDDDRAVLAALYDQGVPIVVVATKVDKISSEEKTDEALEVIRDGLGLPEGQPLSVSTVTGHGIKDLWKIIMEACETGVEEYRDKLLKGGKDAKEQQEVFSDDDDEEIAYNQGFDWIHDSGVMYEGDNEDYEEEESDNKERFEKKEEGGRPQQNEFSLKFLKKKAKKMEQRGEV